MKTDWCKRPIMGTLRKMALGTLVVFSAVELAPRSRAGEFEVVLNQAEQTVVVENPGPAVVPTVYLVGQPDRSAKPVRKTKGVTLNGVRLAESLLSESVLILRPDGTGDWGYHAGFDIFRGPQFENGKRIAPRSLVEYDKWRYDPLETVTCVGGDMNLLRLCLNQPRQPARYEIAFPSPIRIRSVRVGSNCDSLRTAGVVVTSRLFADRECTRLVAERPVGPEQETKRFPIAFEQLDHGRLFLELSAKAPPGVAVDLYRIFFEATLDAADLKLPILKTGKNTLKLTDDADGSHQGRVVLRWVDRPPAERIWDDFEDSFSWSGCKPMQAGAGTGLAFTGNGFARATFPANGQHYAITRASLSEDLSGFNRLGVASRVRRDAPMRAIQFGIKNADSGYQYVWLRPGKRWNFQTFDIGNFKRDQVAALILHWTVVPGYSRPDAPCTYDIDSVCFWHEEPKPPAKRKLPDKIAHYQSPFSDQKPLERQIPPIQEWFPLGFYDGICSRSDKECEWLFDQMKKLHMNTVYISNGTLEGLERILPLAEARGIRLVYQGGGEGSLYYLHLATKQARLGSLERIILPGARDWLPKLRGRWGLAAWSLTEEISPELSRELAVYYELVRELAPEHPPTVLHNNFSAAVADLQTNRPLVVTHDFYPFFWSPRSGPSNPGRSVSYYRGRVSQYYRACREHGASLWMMPQSWGTRETAPLDPPHYGYRSGMRTPEPGEIKLQGWVAIAEGATGLMYYAALASRPDERQLWDEDWTETANTRAAAELFENVTKVAPLLSRLERDYQEAGFVKNSNPKVLAHSFVKRKTYSGQARYVVLASLDGFGSQETDLSITHSNKVYNMITREEVTGELDGIVLPPGEGAVLLVGTAEEFKYDCSMIDGRLEKE